MFPLLEVVQACSSLLLPKKLTTYGIEPKDLSRVYLLPLKVTKEIKLSMFQCKIIHHILPTNSLLHKMKKSSLSILPLLSVGFPNTLPLIRKIVHKQTHFGHNFKIGILIIAVSKLCYRSWTSCLEAFNPHPV